MNEEIIYDIDFDDNKAEDVTDEMKNKCEEKYKDSIKKVLKYGKLYKIFFCFGYTAFGEEMRYARRIAEIQWYSRIATEERRNGYNLDHYIEEFKKNNIYFDGKTIPTFIDTISQVKKRIDNFRK